MHPPVVLQPPRMDTDTKSQPHPTMILAREIHRLAEGHLSVNGAALRVCQQSLSTIKHFLPMIRDHEDAEVRRIATPLLAMLGMTLRNVSHSMMDAVVSPEGLRKAFEEAGMMDDEIATALSHYGDRLRNDDWGRIFDFSQKATSEADSMPETRPRPLAGAQRDVVIDEGREMVVDSHDGIEVDTLLAQIADLYAARRGEARVSLEDGFANTLLVEGARRTVFYLRVSLGDAEERAGAAVALATAVLKAQLRRLETGDKPDRKTLHERLRPFLEATHAAHPGHGITAERYRLSLCYPTPFHDGLVARYRIDKADILVAHSDERLPIAPDVAGDYASLPYGYKLSSSSGWTPTFGTDSHWVDGLALLETVGP